MVCAVDGCRALATSGMCRKTSGALNEKKRIGKDFSVFCFFISFCGPLVKKYLCDLFGCGS